MSLHALLSLSVLTAAALAASTSAHARTWYVDKTRAGFVAPSDRNGDEDTPFERISHALGARGLAPGDVVLVTGADTYAENLTLPDGIRLEAKVHAAVDTGGAPTLLVSEADPKEPGITVTTEHADNAVVGFNIHEGGAERGAGIFVLSGKVLIEDNVFWLNEAEKEHRDPLGGAIAVFDADKLASKPDDYHVIIRGNHFAGNATKGPTGMGGAIGCKGDKARPNLLIEDNTIGLTPLFKNGSPHGGGIGLVHCDATIDGNAIFANLADEGGGIYCGSKDSYTGGRLYVRDNVITYNDAKETGGGLYLHGSCELLEFARNRVEHNGAKDEGGGLYLGSQNLLEPNDTVLKASTFLHNRSDRGAAILAEGARRGLVLDTCEVAENVGTITGAIHLDGLARTVHLGPLVNIESNRLEDDDGTGTGTALYATGVTPDEGAGHGFELAGVLVGRNTGGLATVDIRDSAALAFGDDPAKDLGLDVVDNTSADAAVMLRSSSGLLAGRVERNSARGIWVTGGGAVVDLGAFDLPNVVQENLDGGIRVDAGAEVTLHFNEVRDNTTTGAGGGLACLDGALCRVESTDEARAVNAFSGNEADLQGGGIYLDAVHEDSVLQSVLVLGNTAGTDGGGIAIVRHSGDDRTIWITGGLGSAAIAENTAGARGGGLFVEDSGVVVQGYDVMANSAGTDGGGAWLGGRTTAQVGAHAPGLTIALARERAVTFSGNHAIGGVGGAVAAREGATVNVVGTWLGPAKGFGGNRARVGGAVHDDARSATSVIHSCITNNHADDAAGGAWSDGGTWAWNTFRSNFAEAGSPEIGGGRFAGADRVLNNLFVYNTEVGAACAASPAMFTDNVGYDNVVEAFDPSCDADSSNSGSGFAGAGAVWPECHHPGDDGDPEVSDPAEVGDAPDGTEATMPAGYRGAYASVVGAFPTYRSSIHAVDGRGGPAHRVAGAAWLGGWREDGRPAASLDGDASSPEDADGEPNLDPDAGVADNDAYDDGWDPTHGLPACERTSITLQISADEVRSGLLPRIDGAVVAYVNVAGDWDHDGAWGGEEETCGAPEWAVRDLEVRLSPGETVRVTTPALSTGPDGDAWVRVVLSPAPLDVAPGAWDGSGPAAGWLVGETEDYLICVGDPAICEGSANTDTDTDTGADTDAGRTWCASVAPAGGLPLLLGLVVLVLGRRRR